MCLCCLCPHQRCICASSLAIWFPGWFARVGPADHRPCGCNRNMQYAFRGHICVLMNQETASDGEAFAEGARRLGLGKLIGSRTCEHHRPSPPSGHRSLRLHARRASGHTGEFAMQGAGRYGSQPTHSRWLTVGLPRMARWESTVSARLANGWSLAWARPLLRRGQR